jgi:hypothetical protein
MDGDAGCGGPGDGDGGGSGIPDAVLTKVLSRRIGGGCAASAAYELTGAGEDGDDDAGNGDGGGG